MIRIDEPLDQIALQHREESTGLTVGMTAAGTMLTLINLAKLRLVTARFLWRHISIVIAWMVGPKREKEASSAATSTRMGLVIAATAFE